MTKSDKDVDFSPAPLPGSISVAGVPRYMLYGDTGQRADWFVNTERLDRRCRERGWVIAPHTHPRFTQIMLCTHGGGDMTIEGDSRPFAAGSVVIVPPFRIHGFRYAEATDGWVLTIENNYLSDLLLRAPALRPLLREAEVIDGFDGAALAAIEGMIAALAGELEAGGQGAAIGSEIHLLSTLLLLLRHRPTPGGEARAAGGRHLLVDRYRALVEARYRTQPSIAEAAAELGVSVSQLRHACQSVAGLSPLAILHDRLLSEAKRCLAYTGMSVSLIADWLGFADAAYFSRFFSGRVGRTPTAYRRAQAVASDEAAA